MITSLAFRCWENISSICNFPCEVAEFGTSMSRSHYVVVYTRLLLRQCMDVDPIVKTYPDVGQLAFGIERRSLITLLIYLELYLVAVKFVTFEDENLEKMLQDMA